MYEEPDADTVRLCKKVAKQNSIEAICSYGSRVCGYARADSDYDILLVLSKYSNGVRYFYRTLDERQYAILTVDRKALELDAEKGSFGDFIAGRLMSPYYPIVNADFLEHIEIAVKKRFAEEDLRDLIFEYEELARGLVIKPEYLVLARMKKRSRGYPPLRYSYMKMLQDELREKNMEAILGGYRKALKALTEQKMITYNAGDILFNNEYVDDVLSFKILNKVVNLVDSSKRALSAYITHGRAGKVALEVFAKELTSKLKRELQITLNKQDLEDPKNYLYLRTTEGLTNLNEKSVMLKSIQRLINEKAFDLQPLAGALNEVFLITVNHEKLVVKKFTNWYNIKWFILNIAAYGTKIFSLSGKARLANEYGMNRLLAENNIHVPEIVTISLQDRMLVEKFISGENVLDFLIKAFTTKKLLDYQKRLAFEVGRTIAKIHLLDVVIGDCKPENFVIGKNEDIYVLDLEQGERKGDKAWDVAEFLYFSGHFGSTFTGGLKEFVHEFIDGYCQLGSRRVLRKAAGFRYSRVFLGWTYMPIIKSIASILKSVH